MTPCIAQDVWTPRRWLVAALLGICLPQHAADPSPPTGVEAGSASRLILRAGPLVIGHRGLGQGAPENTLPSFRLALAARADLVELDYHLSKDGVPIVIHDHTLDRTTDATNRWGGKDIAVGTKSAADIAVLDAGRWFSPTFAGTRVPTLVQALETIQPTGHTLIERKSGDAADLVRLLRERNWLDDVVVQSFDWAFVGDAHRLAPDLVLGALGPPSNWKGRKLEAAEKALSPEFLDGVEKVGARAVVWNRQVSAESVAEAHRRGLRVWVYTINDLQEASGLVQLGVDGIITDNAVAVGAQLYPMTDEAAETPQGRTVPSPLPDHPGNIFLQGEPVRVRLPEGLPTSVSRWRLLDDRQRLVRSDDLMRSASGERTPLLLDELGVGWYRIEFDAPTKTNAAWTSAAVLKRLLAPTPGNSPVCVDSATAWFARNDAPQQKRLANLAALAGVNWVRDRLRWADIQPEPGPLATNTTTYDTAAEIQHAAGLKVLQVFHDTPPWAREEREAGGHFAGDLRHAFRLGRDLAVRFKGRVTAWEPWNEANVATFGAHAVDQMCSWQKAAWLGFKAGDPDVIVGWNATAAVPTAPHAEGVLANETWPYFDTYNIHTYDWAHSYADLWRPARETATGRPIWITEADRGTPHMKQAPWFDQDPRLERLKAEFIAQSYSSSLFAGARRHFHFILGNYDEPNSIQFGLLRRDLTPRPAYAALAAVGRCLAGARVLGRWRPQQDTHVYAFRAWPDGQERDVLVAWAEKEVDWDGRGVTTTDWKLPSSLAVQEVVDYLGRSHGASMPEPLGSAPVFVLLPPGQALMLPLEAPPRLAPTRPGAASPVVLQLSLPHTATVRVEDLPWSEGYAYSIKRGESLDLPIRCYNFATNTANCRLKILRQPPDWDLSVPASGLQVKPQDRVNLTATLRVSANAKTRDGWVVLRADSTNHGQPVLAFRIILKE